jgi:hypothetical protein
MWHTQTRANDGYDRTMMAQTHANDGYDGYDGISRARIEKKKKIPGDIFFTISRERVGTPLLLSYPSLAPLVPSCHPPYPSLRRGCAVMPLASLATTPRKGA